MENGRDPESWERVFRPGRHFWTGLTSIYDWIENYGTGGGLSRHLFADGLREASAAVPELEPLAAEYERIGAMWSELAQAVLPEDCSALRRARQLLDAKAELRSAGADPGEIRPVWEELQHLEAEAREDFPLTADACVRLRADLAEKIRSLYEAERGALDRLEQAVA